MKCPRCQSQNPEENRFCRDCGTKLLSACPQCGAEVPQGDKFCGKCGHSLAKLKEVTPTDYAKPQSHAPESLADKTFSTRSLTKDKEEPQEAREVKTRSEAVAPKGLARFVGRSTEKETLKKMYHKVRSGSGQVLELVGEAGVGKSRLLHEFRNMFPQDEYTYLEGRCYHYGGTTPYLPILDIMRTYFGLKEGEGEHLIKRKIKEKASRLGWKLKDFLPPLQEILSLKVEDEAYLKMEPSQKRERIFEAIRELFVQEAQEKPVLLAFEDLHWIDKSSEDFLNYLFGSIENTRILLILLYRPQYRHQLEPKPYHSKIILEELPADSSVELVQSILEHGDVEREIAELILSRAQGNPLFIEEVTQSLLESGFIQKRGNQYVLAGDASNIHLPDTMQEIIGARIDRAGESIKRIMQIGSVIGSEFAFRILQSMMRMKEELRSYLVSFEELAFLHERSSFPEMEYVFKHALIQEVTYNSLFHRKRKEIHGSIGRAIEALYAESIEEYYELLAYHYSNSDDFEKAFQYLNLSGHKATRNYSMLEASHFYRAALDVLNQLPMTLQNKREQIEVRLSLSTTMSFLNWPEDSIQILQEGAELSKEIGDKRSLSVFHSRLGLYYAIHGQPLLAIEHTEVPFEEAEKSEDIDLMAPIACELCVSYLYTGEYSRIIDVAHRVLGILERTHREHEYFGTRYNVYSGLCSLNGYALGMLGNFEEAKPFFNKGLDFALEAGSIYGLGLLEFFYGLSFSYTGDGKQAIDHLEKAMRHLEESQDTNVKGFARAGLGYSFG